MRSFFNYAIKRRIKSTQSFLPCVSCGRLPGLWRTVRWRTGGMRNLAVLPGEQLPGEQLPGEQLLGDRACDGLYPS